MIKLVLFDLDGTVANTNEVILHAFHDTMLEMTGVAPSREVLLRYWGLPLRTQITAMTPELELEAAVAVYRRWYQAHHETMLAEFPGVRAVLEALQARGVRLGVVTSKMRKFALQALEALHYQHLLPLLAADEDTARHKPDAAPLLYAMAQVGATAAETIYVGDNPDDIIAAHAAGMRGVGVGWCLRPRAELARAGADAIIDHPDELLALVLSPAGAGAR